MYGKTMSPRGRRHVVESDALITSCAGRHRGPNQTDPFDARRGEQGLAKSSVKRVEIFSPIDVARIYEYRHSKQSLGSEAEIGTTEGLVGPQQQTRGHD